MKALLILALLTFMGYGSGLSQSNFLPPCPDELVYDRTQEDDEPFTYVEQMPEFPGGTGAMYQFIGNNLTYPDSCRIKGIAGNVIVQFVVDTSGCIVNLKVVRAPASECGMADEALGVMRKMNALNPRWSPGRHGGEKKNVTFTLPIKFVLN